MRVLVVDDDVCVRMALGMQLEDMELIEASRGYEVADLMAFRKPDAVIVDLRLPDGDGLDVVRRIRSLPEGEDVPVIVLTASFDPANRAEVLASGADEYQGKPFEPKEIEDLVRSLTTRTG